MTKAEIVQAIYSRVGGFSKKESADIVDLVFEMMKDTLGRGEKIKVSGFGNFVLRDKRQRPGRNPQTGEPIKISERRVLTFKASQILKQVLNTRPAGDTAVETGHWFATPFAMIFTFGYGYVATLVASEQFARRRAAALQPAASASESIPPLANTEEEATDVELAA